MEPNDKRCRELVAAYRDGERMPPDVRAAAWARLQAALRADVEPDVEPDVVARPRDRRRDVAWAAALLAAAAVLLLLASERRSLRDDTRATDNQAAHEAANPDTTGSIAPLREPAPAPAVAPPPIEPPPVEAPPAPVQVAPRPRPADVPKDIPALDAELALLRAAREAIGRGAPADALAPRGAHAREFPAGLLREERMLLDAQARCALDRRAEARAAAAALVREFPDSPHARTVATLCAD
jgi:hypothetical protein